MPALRIVILGGGGFLGTRLTERLQTAGHAVRIADRRPAPKHAALWVECDVCQPDQVRRACAGQDWAINLAAEHRDDVRPVSRYYDVNVGGARNLCQAAREAGVARILFVSTVAVYGLPDHEADEDCPPQPFNDYGRSKWEAEEVYRAWQREDPARALVLVRPTVVFGEGNRGNFHNLASQIARRRFVMVGAGKNRKSVAYAENVCAFLEFCLRFTQGSQLFNYADKPDLDMNEMVALIRKKLGRPATPGFRLPYACGYLAGALCDAVAAVTRRNLPFSRIRCRKFCASSQIAAARVAAAGFRPPVAMEEAIERTLRADFAEFMPPRP